MHSKNNGNNDRWITAAAWWQGLSGITREAPFGRGPGLRVMN